MRISNPITTHGGLSGIGVNDHHAEAHAMTGVPHTGGINVTQHGALGALANAHAHGDLATVTADQHHAESHTHASHTGIGTGDHHAQLHVAAHRVGGADPIRHVDILKLGG